ncbi:MAG: DMT family transporter [Actinomycetia bacterium]|nr:DMT family transporter [Actinomycetes bacterium]
MTSPSTPVSAEDRYGLGVVGGIVAVSAWGLSGVIAKHIDMGGIAIGAYRFTTYGLVVGLFMTARGTPITLRVMRGSMWGGIALGVDVALFFSAVKHTSIANATVIGALQPVVVAVIAYRFFGEELRRRDVTLGLVALAGAIVVVLAAASDAEPSLDGDLLAGGALFAWAGYFVFSKRAKGVLTSNEYTVGAALWVGAINAPLALLFGQDMSWPSLENWVWLLALAFGAGVLGHAVMNWSIQQIPLWLGSTFTLLIPVVSATAAWVFLDEPLTAAQIIAMGVVLLSLTGVITGQAGVGSRPRPLRR